MLKLRRNHASDVQLILVSHQGYQKLGYNILALSKIVLVREKPKQERRR